MRHQYAASASRIARQVRVSLLGPPGSGKGTQAELLARRFALPHVDTGALLRAEVAAGGPLGQVLARYIPEGLLAPDELVIQVILRRLRQPDARAGFILDGFPRSLPQAERLDAALQAAGRPLAAVILLRVSEQVLWRRLLHRVVCDHCGSVFNELSKPPRPGQICPRCQTPIELVGGQPKCRHCPEPIRRRADDRPEAIAQRLRVYQRETIPAVEHYQVLGILHEVDGEGPEDMVFRRILDVLSQVPAS